MAKAPDPNDWHMTPAHFEGLGRIVNSIAEIETFIDGMIIMLVERQLHLIIPLLSQLSAKAKREFVSSVVADSDLTAEDKDTLIKFMKRIDERQPMRHNAAHNGWAKGTRAGAIKPFSMKVRGGIMFKGNKKDETDYTAADLMNTARQNSRLGLELMKFMEKLAQPKPR